jgi:cytochrome c oxidase subunit 3
MAAATSTAAVDDQPGGRARGPSALSVGVVVWLSSELMFFSGLFAAWFTLRSSTRPWPPAGVVLSTGRTALATLALIASSFTMHRAVGAAARDDRSRAVRWLGVTALLGAAFLANQVWEYADLPFRISSHAYGSVFYLLTGFHGLHVLGGLLFMGAVASMVSGRGSRAPVGPTIEVCAYYWHFVDAVWVAMFATIYLLQ